MSIKEQRHQPKPETVVDSLLERFEQSRAEAAKYAVILLNPLKEHKYLATFGIGGDLTFSDPNNESYFTAFQGIADARTAVDSYAQDPKSLDDEVDMLVEVGMNLLEEVIQTKGRVAVQNNNLFQNVQARSSINGWLSAPQIKEPLAVLNYVCRHELFKGENGSEVYTSDQQKALFAAAVGFAQTNVVKELTGTREGKKLLDKTEQMQQDHRKRTIREKVLGYGLQVLTAEGQPGLLHYLTAQKYYQAELPSKN